MSASTQAVQPGRYLARLWSTAHAGVLRALVEQHGALGVWLGTHPGNPVDEQAVAILAELPERVAGGMSCSYGNDARPMRLVGYVSRSEPRKPQLHAELSQAAGEQPAWLKVEGPDWVVEIAAEPDPDDVPF